MKLGVALGVVGTDAADAAAFVAAAGFTASSPLGAVVTGIDGETGLVAAGNPLVGKFLTLGNEQAVRSMEKGTSTCSSDFVFIK